MSARCLAAVVAAVVVVAPAVAAVVVVPAAVAAVVVVAPSVAAVVVVAAAVAAVVVVAAPAVVVAVARAVALDACAYVSTGKKPRDAAKRTVQRRLGCLQRGEEGRDLGRPAWVL